LRLFYFGHVFTFLTFFYFPSVFLILKTLAKFRAASRLTRSTFKITATKQTYDFPVACRILIEDFTASRKRRQFLQNETELHIPSCLEGHSWTSGVELNYTKKR